MKFEDNTTTISLRLEGADIEYSDTWIRLNDPLFGRLTLTREEFKHLVDEAPEWWMEELHD